MDYGLLKALRKLLVEDELLMERAKSVHLTMPPKKSYPLILLSLVKVDNGANGDALIHYRAQVFSKDINLGELMSLSFLLSSTLDGLSLELKDEVATSKWASSTLNENSKEGIKVIEQSYCAHIKEPTWTEI